MHAEQAAKFEITELVSRYGNALDAGEFDALEALFTPDAVFRILPQRNVPDLEGRQAIRAAVENRWSLVHEAAQRRHAMSNIVVESIDGDQATVRTVLVVYETPKTERSSVNVHGAGIYQDHVVRTDEGWRFAERCLTLDRLDYFAPGWTSTD